MIAAAVVGLAALAAGWRWAALLVIWFVLSHALTMRGARAKAARAASVLAPEHGRRARQVLANGGVFAAAALLGVFTNDPRWSVAALGALAAAAADTWGTELGLLAGGTPRSIVTGARVEPGTSGGVTLAGSAGAIAGAAMVALVAWLLQLVPFDGGTFWPTFVGITAAGVLGALADSILGATLQARRRCLSCGARTEREQHSCGGATVHDGGLRPLDNDLVNLLCTLAGALAAIALL